jgi:hypothetical protein
MRAARIALLATAVMVLVTVVLFYAGICFGWFTMVLLAVLLPDTLVFPLVFIGVPATAGAIWALCLAFLVCVLLEDAPSSWLKAHCIWGAISGPLMLWSQLVMRSPYGPALTTAVVAFLLFTMSWQLLRHQRFRPRPGNASLCS